MKIPDKNLVVQKLSAKYSCPFSSIKRKQIMYEGMSNKQKIVFCTPSSKLHPQGMGWFDLTTIQVELLDNADIAELAVCLQGNKVYYIDFKKLRKLMTSNNMRKNTREGEHWKLHVWEKHIQVQGNNQKYMVEPEAVLV